jgi:hypothetical protein
MRISSLKNIKFSEEPLLTMSAGVMMIVKRLKTELKGRGAK